MAMDSLYGNGLLTLWLAFSRQSCFDGRMAAEPADVDKEITDLYHHLLAAWNARDASGMAALFHDDGSVVGFDGSQMNGRATISAELGDIFAKYPTATFVGLIREIRSLGPEGALLRAEVGMVPRDLADINPALNAIQSLVAVRLHSGVWRIALFQNTPAAFHGRPELSEKLTEELRAEVQRLHSHPHAHSSSQTVS